jgi:hypothetical protein
MLICNPGQQYPSPMDGSNTCACRGTDKFNDTNFCMTACEMEKNYTNRGLTCGCPYKHTFNDTDYCKPTCTDLSIAQPNRGKTCACPY